MKKLISIVLLLSTSFVFAQATDDNEIMIEQSGDTLTLYIERRHDAARDQCGFAVNVGAMLGIYRLFETLNIETISVEL